MATIPAKVLERLAGGLKRFQPILTAARARDVNESDTVTIVVDMLAELFGYDKYSEVTKEFVIRATYCDLAIKIDGNIAFLIEVKAIGLDLKEQHVKQAIDYAANQGVEWVALTNGYIWRVFRVIFAKPIDMEVVAEIDLLSLNPKNQQHLDQLYLLSREGWVKSTLSAYYTQRQATNRFFLGAIIQTDAVVEAIRKQLRTIAPDVRVQPEEIKSALVNEVLKREVVEGDKAIEARKKVEKAAKPLSSPAPRVKKVAAAEDPPAEIGEVKEIAPAVDISALETVIEDSVPPSLPESPEANS